MEHRRVLSNRGRTPSGSRCGGICPLLWLKQGTTADGHADPDGTVRTACLLAPAKPDIYPLRIPGQGQLRPPAAGPAPQDDRWFQEEVGSPPATRGIWMTDLRAEGGGLRRPSRRGDGALMAISVCGRPRKAHRLGLPAVVDRSSTLTRGGLSPEMQASRPEIGAWPSGSDSAFVGGRGIRVPQ